MSSVVGKKTFGGIGVVGGTFVVVDDSVGVLKVVATITVHEMMQRTSALIRCAARKMSECSSGKALFENGARVRGRGMMSESV